MACTPLSRLDGHGGHVHLHALDAQQRERVPINTIRWTHLPAAWTVSYHRQLTTCLTTPIQHISVAPLDTGPTPKDHW